MWQPQNRDLGQTYRLSTEALFYHFDHCSVQWEWLYPCFHVYLAAKILSFINMLNTVEKKSMKSCHILLFLGSGNIRLTQTEPHTIAYHRKARGFLFLIIAQTVGLWKPLILYNIFPAMPSSDFCFPYKENAYYKKRCGCLQSHRLAPRVGSMAARIISLVGSFRCRGFRLITLPLWSVLRSQLWNEDRSSQWFWCCALKNGSKKAIKAAMHAWKS